MSGGTGGQQAKLSWSHVDLISEGRVAAEVTVADGRYGPIHSCHPYKDLGEKKTHFFRDDDMAALESVIRRAREVMAGGGSSGDEKG